MNGFGLLVAGIIAVACSFATVHLRRRLSGYQAKIMRLKEEINVLQQQLDSNDRLDFLVAEVNEAVLRIHTAGRMVIAANSYARDIFAMGNSILPQPMLQIYRDADWNELLVGAIAALPEKTKLPQIELPGRVLEPRLAQLENGEALLLCLDVTARHKLEQQRRTFLSNLMHDLKTPLTSLLGYARSMESFGDQADFRKEAAAVIANEAKHVNHLLDVLLTLDQIEFEEKDRGACCDGLDVIRRSCDMLASQCKEKHASLIIDHGKEELLIAAAFDDVDRIVTNLLVNAVNHSPDEGHIDVRLIRLDGRCKVTIEDEGPGIAEKHLPRVTERFYRVDKSRNRQMKSHGLGLSIVKELLDANGGELKLSNRDPHGLRAEFTLPMKQ
ncbi:MAG: ATP-binding protein [Mariprofundus sp.]|nr:ATP-binding protein [Mariprofundus sp.]